MPRALALALSLVLCQVIAKLGRLSRPVRTLLIDNYDSYTYNLWQLLAEINGCEPLVVFNNAFDDWSQLKREVPAFDNIVLSPGPGNPSNPADFGLCMGAIREANVPLLGVCLGHQGLALAHGATVSKAPLPMHGRLSPIFHSEKGLFRGVVQGTSVVRYHSLLAYGVEHCSDLEETAWALDPSGKRLVMGLQHKCKPMFGVQFHPESISTHCGRQLLGNFRDITVDLGLAEAQRNEKIGNYQSPVSSISNLVSSSILSATPQVSLPIESDRPVLYAHVSSVALPLDLSPTAASERLFCELYGSSASSFWLDSAFPNNQSTAQLTNASTLSMLGALDCNGAFSVEYLSDNRLIKRTVGGDENELQNRNIFEFLQEHVKGTNTEVQVHQDDGLHSTRVTQPELSLPFDVSGSLFGYLGYEARHEATHILQRDSGLNSTHDGTFVGSRFTSTLPHPTALFLAPRRHLVVDHDNRRIYTVSTAPLLSTAREQGRELMERADNVLQNMAISASSSSEASPTQRRPDPRFPSAPAPPTLRGGLRWAEYRQSIERCLHHISLGETYEVCLTTQFSGKLSTPPPLVGSSSRTKPVGERASLGLYKTLRKHNPAPYACYFHYDPRGDGLFPRLASASSSQSEDAGLSWCRPGGLSVCCSSPERYLKSTADGLIESKPIKGTMRRSADPKVDHLTQLDLARDEKSRAENLMIVDLVRNDLGRVARVGSVHVPGLMSVESFKTVHHLVSTIRAQLRPQFSIVDAIVATFPGGSMTGAPKLRTMGIIEDEEKRGRGVYSGAIGYISRSGASDLNIAIRTAVIAGDDITVSSGGAIIALSDPAAEVDEAVLKAQAVSKAIGFALCGQDDCYGSDDEKEVGGAIEEDEREGERKREDALAGI